MVILSHRGYWKREEEKNRSVAFERSFNLGFAAELDLRDDRGALVVSHDMPGAGSMDFRSLLEVYCKFDKKLPLAINIKSGGLQRLLLGLLKEYRIENYFVFDMSVPDTLEYLNLGMKVFTRESEFEATPAFYEEADGVWMDEFTTSWITQKRIQSHLDNGKKVSIVSPELHHREHLARWKDYKALLKCLGEGKFMLCTDFPEEARSYFND